jgi:hypothetical protein
VRVFRAIVAIAGIVMLMHMHPIIGIALILLAALG